MHEIIIILIYEINNEMHAEKFNVYVKIEN